MRDQRFGRRQVWHLAAGAVFVTGTACAQSARSVLLRGTIDSADAKSINLTTRSGQQLTISVASDAVIVAIVPTKLEDIKAGSFIGSAAMPQPDGTQRAMEVHVFPEAMRGTGEGHRPFDLQPRSTMTNGTVGKVSGAVGRTLTVAYQGGEKTIVVPPDTPVVTFEPGSPALLAAGAHVIVMGTEASDGKLSASRISVGKDGLVPQM
jgi:Domain of unknown function (DUF5666)